MPTTNSTPLTAASQLAVMRAQQSGPGFSKDPGDYKLPWIKLSGPEFNNADPKYRSDIPDLGFLIGDNVISPKGARVIIAGMTMGHREVDRVTVNGRETTRLYALWRSQPEATPVKGRGGGLRTDRGGWLSGKLDEIFTLTAYGPTVLTLFDQHDIVAELNQSAQSLGVGAMYEAAWTLTKASVPDGDYTRYEPHFELLGIAGDAEGPTKAELAQAGKLSELIARISYPIPGVPLKLVANSGPIGEPPEDRATPVQSESDYDGGRPDLDSDIPF
jgi:hypothetical protein